MLGVCVDQISHATKQTQYNKLTFLARHDSPSESSVFRLLLLSSPFPFVWLCDLKVRSISRIETSTSFPASAKVVEDDEAEARARTGPSTVYDKGDFEPETWSNEVGGVGWNVRCPDVNEDMTPLFYESAHCRICQTTVRTVLILA